MSLTKFTGDVNVVSTLPDEPNDVGGLSSAELKAKFDAAGASLKTFLNETLLPELEAAGVLALIQHGTDSCKYIRLNADGAIQTSADGATWVTSASSGHLIYDKNGNLLTQRTRLKFANSTVTDDGTYTVVTGIKGDTGATGAKGDTGTAATIQIGTVTTGAEGSSS
jgi:hypothetical protein